MLALEGEIRVDEAEVARVRRVEETGRLGPVGEQLETTRGDASIRESGTKPLARITGHRGGAD
jgi:hypothetical protein